MPISSIEGEFVQVGNVYFYNEPSVCHEFILIIKITDRITCNSFYETVYKGLISSEFSMSLDSEYLFKNYLGICLSELFREHHGIKI